MRTISIKGFVRMIPLLCLLPLLTLTSCGTEPYSTSGSQANYKDIKSMVLDILKTEDGQQAINEAASNPLGLANEGKGMQMLSTKEGQQLQLAVKEVLTDPTYPKVLEKLMTDPRFAAEFAKSVNEGNKQIHKDLMKDPEYQQSMLDVMKNPEFEKMLIDVMKGKQFRQQTMTVMQESLKSPLFRVEMLQLIKKAMEEEAEPKGEIKQNKEEKNDENERKDEKQEDESEKEGESGQS